MNDSSSDVPLLRLLATGVACLFVGFVLWFGLLAVDTVVFFLQISRHPHQHDFHAVSLIGAAWGVACLYSLSFFVAAFVIGGLRWSFRPVFAAPLVHALFLACYLPTLDWGRGSPFETAGLFVPLATSAFGAFLGERLSAKRRSA
jgi:hypothetical protein